MQWEFMIGTGSLVKPQEDRLRRVEGRHNALLKELRKAFARGELTPSGECALEGFRIVEEALRSGVRLRAVFFSESAKPRAGKLLPQIGAHVETLLLPDKLFASAVPTQAPQGVAALAQVRVYTVEDVLENSSNGVLAVVAGVQDPGNLGTILRSAEAFRVRAVLLGEGTVSLYNSKVVRASAGSVFRVPATTVEIAALIARLRERGVRSIGASSHKGTPLADTHLTGTVAVFVGNEGAGIHKRWLGEMDEMVTIPHSPRVESLNAGVAASIVFYEANRQRRGIENPS